MLLRTLILLILGEVSSINPTNEEVMKLLLTRRIGHGSPASLGELPYQVAIKSPARGYGNGQTYSSFCGGTIITERKVLTAAHCFVRGNTLHSGRINQDVLINEFVVAGNVNNFATYSIEDNDVDGQWRRIKEIRFPVTYEFPTDDIAVLHLRKAFVFNPQVDSISYAKQFKDYGGYHCIASGYGRINDREFSQVLRKANLEILSVSMCNKLFEFSTNKMVCTTDEISDVLEGDSGGPLVCLNTEENGEKGVLVGVTSGGYTGVGSVFTRVSAYKNFIAKGKQETLLPDKCSFLGVVILMIIAS